MVVFMEIYGQTGILYKTAKEKSKKLTAGMRRIPTRIILYNRTSTLVKFRIYLNS